MAQIRFCPEWNLGQKWSENAGFQQKKKGFFSEIEKKKTLEKMLSEMPPIDFKQKGVEKIWENSYFLGESARNAISGFQAKNGP